MMEKFAELDTALERVIAAARAHLDAVKAADGAPDDDAVWNAYVALNNASHTYDELLNDVFGEVTPWDLEEISGAEAEGRVPTVTLTEAASAGDDPYPHIISVRQRRDYRVPSIAQLLHVAEEGRPMPDGEAAEPITTVGEAVLELLQSGDGSLGMLDLPELEPLDGIVVVVESAQALNLEQQDESDGEAPFRLTGTDRTIGRLDERSVVGIEEP